MKAVIIILTIIGFLFLLFLVVRKRSAVEFSKQVRTLFAQSPSISNQLFQAKQLDSLPEPVQRYFKYILKEGQPYISFARIKHEGQFKAGLEKGWMNIKGEQYATTAKPGFIWKGTTAMFVARDMYIADQGRLIVSLFSLFNVIDARGEQYNQGELLRWLAESILYPTNFLPSDTLHWTPIDDKTANLTFTYNGLYLFFKITFNKKGEIIEMETKRYMDVSHLETWVIKVSAYRELNKVIVPTSFDVLWRLEKGDFSYAKFNITEIDYDKPEEFK